MMLQEKTLHSSQQWRPQRTVILSENSRVRTAVVMLYLQQTL